MTCPRCDLSWRPGGQALVGFRLGRSLTGDVMFVANRALQLAEQGDDAARTVARVLEAVELALRRQDAAQLSKLERLARPYRATRKDHEKWHGSWVTADSASLIRELVEQAERFNASAQTLEIDGQTVPARGYVLATTVQHCFPWLPGVATRAGVIELARAIAADAEGRAAGADLVAERALKLAGMPADEAHKRFAFRRMAAGRARKKSA